MIKSIQEINETMISEDTFLSFPLLPSLPRQGSGQTRLEMTARILQKPNSARNNFNFSISCEYRLFSSLKALLPGILSRQIKTYCCCCCLDTGITLWILYCNSGREGSDFSLMVEYLYSPVGVLALYCTNTLEANGGPLPGKAPVHTVSHTVHMTVG